MSAWRQAGLNYINYSNIAARLLRQALKPEPRAEALKRADTHIRITKWVDGKPIKILLNETYFNDLTLPIKHHGYGNHRRIRPAELGKLTLYAAEIELKHDWHHGLIHRGLSLLN